MRFYAERPQRMARQLLVDVLVLCWVVVCVLLARASYAVVLRLQGPGASLAQSGTDMRNAFEQAASTAGRIPLIGNTLAQAFGSGSTAGAALAASGQDQVEAIQTMATGTAVSVVLVGALPVVLLWAWVRARYALAARAAIAIRRDDPDLLALRALTRLPMNRLAGLGPDPAGAWRRGDPTTVHRLAEMELRDLGLRAPSEQGRPRRHQA